MFNVIFQMIYTLPFLFIGAINAYQRYQTAMPNGANVPNPCTPETAWPGVGHVSSYGSGTRNSFGAAFQLNNHIWNAVFCNADSDGDGQTNGQELGDPNCVWITGATPLRTVNLTHPGVCEPVSSTLCQGKNSGQGITTNLCGAPTKVTVSTTTTTTISSSKNSAAMFHVHYRHFVITFLLLLIISYQ